MSAAAFKSTRPRSAAERVDQVPLSKVVRAARTATDLVSETLCYQLPPAGWRAMHIEPFHIAVPEHDIDDLRRRIRAARSMFPEGSRP